MIKISKKTTVSVTREKSTYVDITADIAAFGARYFGVACPADETADFDRLVRATIFLAAANAVRQAKSGDIDNLLKGRLAAFSETKVGRHAYARLTAGRPETASGEWPEIWSDLSRAMRATDTPRGRAIAFSKALAVAVGL